MQSPQIRPPVRPVRRIYSSIPPEVRARLSEPARERIEREIALTAVARRRQERRDKATAILAVIVILFAMVAFGPAVLRLPFGG